MTRKSDDKAGCFSTGLIARQGEIFFRGATVFVIIGVVASAAISSIDAEAGADA